VGNNVPAARYYHTAIWDGAEMTVWGGDPGTATGGRYCACSSSHLVYRDADGDGYGDPGTSITICDSAPPLGYVLDATDCNDAEAGMHPGSGEACDLTDGVIFEWRKDKTSVSWQPEQGFDSWNVYVGDLDVLRAIGAYTQLPGSNALAARQCGVSVTTVADPAIPDPGKASFSLVTGVSGGDEGSLGSATGGPRTNLNPCP
jgi:hypothetical protein